MPKLNNLVKCGTLLWCWHQGAFHTAEYRGQTVDRLHEVEIVPDREDVSGPVIAVPRSALLVTEEIALQPA